MFRQNENEEINCYNSKKKYEDYYFDGNKFKFCWNICKYCTSSGNEHEHNCTECKENFLPIINKDEDELFNCAQKDSYVDGYYSNGIHFLKCYILCKTCSATGTEEKNNCDSCNFTYGYYKFEDADEIIDLYGQCSQTDYPGYHYLYDPKYVMIHVLNALKEVLTLKIIVKNVKTIIIKLKEILKELVLINNLLIII